MSLSAPQTSAATPKRRSSRWQLLPTRSSLIVARNPTTLSIMHAPLLTLLPFSKPSKAILVPLLLGLRPLLPLTLKPLLLLTPRPLLLLPLLRPLLPDLLANVPVDGLASSPMASAVVLVVLRPRPNRSAIRSAHTSNTAKTAELFLRTLPSRRL